MKTQLAQITLSYSCHADISSETPIEIARCLRHKHVIVLTVVVSRVSCRPGYSGPFHNTIIARPPQSTLVYTALLSSCYIKRTSNTTHSICTFHKVEIFRLHEKCMTHISGDSLYKCVHTHTHTHR